MKRIIHFTLLILILISCNQKDFPTSFNEIKFPKQLTSSGKDFAPYWSPDGKYIAFLSTRNTYNPEVAVIRFELWLMRIYDYYQYPLISINDLNNGSIALTNINWSNNSHDLLLQIYSQMGSEIWKVTINGDKTRMSSIYDWTERAAYSPDNLKIAFLIQGPTPLLRPPVYHLYVSNYDFSEPVCIENGLIQKFEWINTSDQLIYSLYNDENENYELWKCSITGDPKSQFSNTPVNEQDPSCSTDGEYICFTVENSVYVTPSDTFRAEKVIDNASNPKWVPDSYLLSITREQTLDNNSFFTESCIVDLDGNIFKQIAQGNTTVVSFLSNGKYFVYSLEGNLWMDQLVK